MRPVRGWFFGFLAGLAGWMTLSCLAEGQQLTTEPPNWSELAAPVVEGRWVRPAPEGPAQPVWGHAEGIRVGLAPMPGPRGLLRIYAPFLGHPEGRMINYVAVEPIPAGQQRRGFSELEHSKLDGVRGKRLWSADEPDASDPRAPDLPARGQVLVEDGMEMLRVFVPVEAFDNGAHLYLRLTFRADRPNEVGIATFVYQDSRPLDYSIVTATMGNYARLRRLRLADRVVLSTELWPTYRGDGFTPHGKFGLAELARTAEGHAVALATPNEARPQDALYSPGTRQHWRYLGDVATQSWRSEAPHPRLQVWVNGRAAYWASEAPIPGGVSYENFEMVAPFRQGQEFWFRVQPGVDGAPGDGR
jgi:hypothetical protein